MTYRPWPKRRKYLFRKLLTTALALLLLGAGAKTLQEAKTLIALYGEKRCENLVTNAILDAVSTADMGEKLIAFTVDENTGVYQLNSGDLRDCQTQVGTYLTRSLDALGEQTHWVPLGTILENVFLIGQGPEIAIRYVPIGSARVEVGSELTDAGVNQVLYRVTMAVSVDMTVLVPGGTRKVRCDQQLVLAETLISGQVPLVYGG